MSEQPEVGRPNYTAGGSSLSRSRPGAPQNLPQGPDDGRLRIRSVIGFGAAIFAWTWLAGIYHVALWAPFYAAALATRCGVKARDEYASARSDLLANIAWVAGLAFLAYSLSAAVYQYFGEHTGFDGVIRYFFGSVG